MGLNQDEHDKNPIWKGCDTDSRQCRAYRSEKQELVAEKLTQEVMPAQKSQATSDDFEIFQHTVILIFVFFFCGSCCIVYSGERCGTSTAQVQEGEQTLLQRSVVLEPYESQTFQHLVGNVNPVLGVSEDCN